MRKQYPTSAACICNVGKRRSKNEDDFYIYGRTRGGEEILKKPLYFRQNKRDDFDGSWQFYAVFDGMGGGDYGDVASQTAALGTKEFLEDENNIQPYDITISLNAMSNDLNKKVCHTAKNLGTKRMGTTLCSLFFYEGMFWVCNLGDTRAYLLRNGKLFRLSKDHTDEAEMKKLNITGIKPQVTQYLGIDPEETSIVPYIRSAEMLKNDVFLICSDGLTDMVSIDTIKQTMASRKNVADCVTKLMDAALKAGGKDNITIIAIE